MQRTELVLATLEKRNHNQGRSRFTQSIDARSDPDMHQFGVLSSPDMMTCQIDDPPTPTWKNHDFVEVPY
jgi:hypothetical protein